MSETSETQEKQPNRGSARRRAMMDAAWQLLLEKGFSGVTLNDVIARSGGSRTTLYEAFGGKDGLLAAVMTEQCSEFSEELHISLESDLPPRDTLMRFAKKLATEILTEEAIRFTQILFTEGQHFRPMIDNFIAHGPQSTRTRLARYLRRQTEAGFLAVEDPDCSAEMFISMVVGDWQEQMEKVHNPRSYSTKQIDQRVRTAVNIFLSGTASINYRETLGQTRAGLLST
ncbi:TetR/AcrR family transcriptional regulator [Thalassospira alkalitolerans]|uniref:TetR/AcrR family transcriptional regulator n=1 Tax=Thalassospira alkalitolerans TaxID=1293890 RepID=UPI003AA827BD